MEIRIEYATNEQGWALERIAAQNDYTKTQDCYWTQIFENANGDRIVTTLEKTVNGDPAAELTARLAPAAEEQQEELTAPIDGEDAPGRDVLGAVREYLESLDDAEKVYIWNEYADAANNTDDHIYSIDEFDEVFSNTNPWEIARACFYSQRFNPSDSWFWFNGYANVESADYISEHDDRNPIDISAVAGYIVDNDEDFYNDDIRAILDGEEVRA